MGTNRSLGRQGVIYYSSFHTCLPDENALEVHLIIHPHFLTPPFSLLLSEEEYLIDFIYVAHVTLLYRGALPPATDPI